MKSLARLALSAAVIPFIFIQGAKADGLSGAPAPFDNGGVKVALISY
ncbi:sugar ABC transporter substrate-binding protein, partial [Rhizobium ruizarguesonis]